MNSQWTSSAVGLLFCFVGGNGNVKYVCSHLFITLFGNRCCMDGAWNNVTYRPWRIRKGSNFSRLRSVCLTEFRRFDEMREWWRHMLWKRDWRVVKFELDKRKVNEWCEWLEMAEKEFTVEKRYQYQLLFENKCAKISKYSSEVNHFGINSNWKELKFF